jgi:hypothetical protein
MACHGHSSRLDGMLELPVTTALINLLPAILVDQA